VNGFGGFMIGLGLGALIATQIMGYAIDQHCVCDAAAEPCRTPAPCVEYVPETCYMLIQVGDSWIPYRYECGHCAAYGVAP
jgi:hypothetical protein